MQGLVHLQFRDINGNVLGQIFRQTGDIKLCHRVRQNTAINLHTRSYISAFKVQRHLHVQFFGCLDSLEVDMQHDRPVRVHLHLAQDHLLRTGIGLQIDDRRMKGLFSKAVHYLMMIQHQAFIALSCAVDDYRHLFIMALPPACIGAKRFPQPGIEFVVTAHYRVSLHWRPRRRLALPEIPG